MTKEEIIQYILNSPENTNSNVLRGMLDELDSGGGKSVTYIEDINGILDHTYAEILELIENKEIVAIIYEEKIYYIAQIQLDEKSGLYAVISHKPPFGVSRFYEAAHTDDYPTIT